MPRRSEAPPTPEELLRILHSGTNVSRQENERMKRQLRALSAAWINRTNVDDDIPPGISPDLPVMEASAMRLELAGLRMLAGKPQSETDAYINVMMESDPSIGLGLRCAIYKDRGHQHFKDGKYLEAVDMYKEGMRQILGKDTVLPSTEYLNKKYMDLKEGDWRLYIDLMECCERISACYERMNKPVEFVDWVEEIGMIYTCIRLARKPDEPSWISYHINFVEWFSFRVIADERAATVFRLLGNTSTASWFSRAAFKNTNHFQHPSLTAMRDDLQWMDLAQIYHPNFRQLHTLQITQPDMQVRGVWKKIKPVASTSSASKPCGRSKHSAWIWNNRLYVAGGVTEVGSDIRDIWSFDLTERTWKQLPAMPNVAVEVNFKCSRNMSIWEDKAYWFTGSRTVWSFDLRAEKWSSLQTKFKGRWPYKTQNLTQYGSVTVDGRLYIFGGEDEVTCLGCNIFMALDLRTLEWEHLSGTSSNTPQIYKPNLRTFPSVFSIPKEKKIYVIGGNAGRSWAKRFPGKPHGSEWDHTYDDFWSFDIPTKKWHRERRRGNFPPPRTQMTATYNSNMERAVVYGGYNQEMMSAGYAEFALFGDAYLFNPETKLWQLVIALGFPSYRGSATMVSDPDTGKVYMFGGYTDTAYVPIKTAATRCFSDVWQLKVDMKGGDMSEEDLQIDWRTESVGPWKRCYSCANVGTDYKKCGGTCGGKWYFCSTECLRNGWPQHKASEGCKKK